MGANETLVKGFELERDRKQALDRLKEILVREAAEFLREDWSKPRDMGDKQIRNLVVMAQKAATPLEVKAFIDYQMGRDTHTQNWRHEIDGQPFGEALKREIEKVEALAKKECPGDKEFVLRCLAQFFGYLGWRVKYLDYHKDYKEKNKNRGNGGERRGSHR